jgi:sulfur carrier protein ThiS
MKITVHTVEWLSHHLPGQPSGHEAEVEVGEDATPEDVIAQLALPNDYHYLVEIDGAPVPHAEHRTRGLEAGQVLKSLPEPKVAR